MKYCVADASALQVNEEIDSCAWFDFETARKEIKDGSLAEEFLCGYLNSL